MTIRTTVAFDPATVARWERLTKRWGTSKSETLRRALEAAEKENPPSLSEPDFTGMKPRQIMDWLAAQPSLKIPGGWGSHSQRELRELDAQIEEERELTRLHTASQRTTTHEVK